MLKGTLKKLSGSKKIKTLKKKSKDDSEVKKKKKKKEEEEIEFEDEIEEEETEDVDDEEEEEGFGDELEEALEEELDEDTSAGKISEFEGRIKDLENEVGLVSSKLNTIRAENEEIGKRVQEIEENIRKLLGIYEIVTEGINPFATEVVGSEDGLGLFSFKKDKKEDVPEEILSQDPESFFEDVDEGEELDETQFEDIVDIGESKKPEKASESPEDTFKRLKEEMNKEKEKKPEEVPEEDTVTVEPEIEMEEIEANEMESKEVEVGGIKVEVEDSGKNVKGPYLSQLKKDFVSDIIALKWMDYLVNTFGIKRMAEILDFYTDIGWISKSVKDLLINYSRGYVLREMHVVEEPNTPTLRDHIRSLIFIAKLGGFDLEIDEIERVIKEIENFEKEASEVITPEHAISSNC